MMSRKAAAAAYVPGAKVSSPTTSDGSNSSADNNYSYNGPTSPRKKLADGNNGGGSPGRNGVRNFHSLAEYHQDFQQKMPQQQPQVYDEPGTPGRPRFVHSSSESALSRSGVYAKSGGAVAGGSGGYFAEGSSVPTGAMARQRDTPEQVTGLVRD